MRKYDLLRSATTIIRVLSVKDSKALILDCIKQNMPVWTDATTLATCTSCPEEELRNATGTIIQSIDALESSQRRTMYDRYSIIAPVLPFVADDKMRSRIIRTISKNHKVSKQTIRNHLCLYLAYMDITVLAPKSRSSGKSLTQDEKKYALGIE